MTSLVPLTEDDTRKSRISGPAGILPVIHHDCELLGWLSTVIGGEGTVTTVYRCEKPGDANDGIQLELREDLDKAG